MIAPGAGAEPPAGGKCDLLAEVGGLTLAVHAAAPALLRPLAEALADFPHRDGVAPAGSSGIWRILLSRRRGLPPSPRLTTHGEGRTPEGLRVRAGWRSGGRHLLVEDKLGLRVDERRRTVVCRCGDAPELLGTTAGIALLDAILEAEKQYLQHAAFLALPPSLASACGGEGAVMLLGDSGAGKSTTALALARGGWALGADDACVLRQEEGAIVGWPFPRDYKVHRRSVDLMPWLAEALPRDLPFDAEEEVGVGRDELSAALALHEPPLRELPLRAVCWLGPRSATGHAARALGASEAAVRLSAEAISAPLRRLDPSSRAQFALFTRLATMASWRFELSLGEDLDGLPGWLEELFRRTFETVEEGRVAARGVI